MNQKLLLIVVILLILVGAGSYILGTNKNKASTSQLTQAFQCKTDIDCEDNNVCTDDICEKGVCSNSNSVEGKSCGATLPDQGQTNFCDGSGKCVNRGPIQPGPLEDPETARWKIHVNNYSNYEIQYPDSWIAEEVGLTTKQSISHVHFYADPLIKYKNEGHIVSGPTTSRDDNWCFQLKKDVTSKVRTIEVSDVEVKEHIIQLVENPRADLNCDKDYPKGTEEINGIFRRNNMEYNYVFYIKDGNRQIVDKMLSTFKSTN